MEIWDKRHLWWGCVNLKRPKNDKPKGRNTKNANISAGTITFLSFLCLSGAVGGQVQTPAEFNGSFLYCQTDTNRCFIEEETGAGGREARDEQMQI